MSLPPGGGSAPGGGLTPATAGPPLGSAARPVGLFQFVIEGRRAPALFVVGWISFLLGLGATFVGYLVAGGGGSPILLVVGLAVLVIGLLLLGGSATVEREAAGRAYAGPSPILVFATIYPAVLLAAYAVGTPLEAAGVHLDLPVGNLLVAILQAVVFVAVIRVMVIGPGALAWSDMGFRVPIGRALTAVVGGALFAAPIVFITGIVALLLVNVFGATPPSPLPPTGTTSGLVLNLLTGAVVAPIAEETVFRGFALTAWQRDVGARSAIIRSALLFAFAHVLDQTGTSAGPAIALAIVAGAARIPVALALGWVYVRFGTIWASIGLHAAFNAILIVIAELSVRGILGS